MTAPLAPAPAAAHRGGLLPRIFRRSNLPLLALAVLALLLLVVSALRNRPAQPPPFDLDSTTETGLRGLDLWLQELGYDVRRIGGLQFRLPQDADLLFVYPNQLSYTAAEAQALREWVAGGRTLVLVGPHPEDAQLERVFGVRSKDREGFDLLQRQVQPLAPEGGSEYWLEWNVDDAVLNLEDAPAAVPLLAIGREPSAAVQQVGNGVVWHLAPGSAFTNVVLAEQELGELLPPLLREVPPGGVVAFDTYHQFGLSRVGEQIVTLQDWLYRTPTGWATLFAVLVGGAFLVLQGRRLGPPVVTRAERRKREAAEYVEAMASLSRRAHLSNDVARYQQQRLKRGLCRRRPLDPDLPNDLFLQRLAYSEPPLSPEQQAEVGHVLAALNQRPGEQQLVTLAARIDQLLGQLS
jgi:hypothetical protein